MPGNNTELIIGPLLFTHAVQKIAIQERKAVSLLDTTRSTKNFVVDSGESEHKASIRLLFTGMDEINGKASRYINPTSSGDNDRLFARGMGLTPSKSVPTAIESLRALIVLFKCCPVVSVKNDYLTNSWKRAEQNYDNENTGKILKYLQILTNQNSLQNQATLGSAAGSDTQDDGDKLSTGFTYRKQVIDKLNNFVSEKGKISLPRDVVTLENLAAPLDSNGFGGVVSSIKSLKRNRVYSDYVPVALESIELENVPDIPYAIQATLTISRIDVSAFSENDSLQYMRRNGGPSESPMDAYWLETWIDACLKDESIVPILKESDFETATIDWYGKNAIGEPVETTVNKQPYLTLGISTNVGPKNEFLVAESCSLRHKFAYNKMMGQTYPFAMHMGTTSRQLSMDIVFNNQDGYDGYRRFSTFKDTADQISKSIERIDRVVGWNIYSPISKLLSHSVDKTFVPVSVFSETGDQPDMINCRIDMVETNVRFYEQNEIVLVSGGTDFNLFKQYYDKTCANELLFRRLLVTDKIAAIKEITGESESSNYKYYNLFWPIEKGVTKLKQNSTFGVLNIDTIRAAFLEMDSGKAEDPGELRAALLGSAIATGLRIANRRIYFFDKAKAAIKAGTAIFAGVDMSSPEEARIFNRVKALTKKLYNESISDGELNNIAENITLSFLGEPNKAAEVISKTSSSVYRFTNAFLNALFNVIVDRKAKPANLPNIYSTDGIYSAFYKLAVSFKLEVDSFKTTDLQSDRNEVLDLTAAKKHSNLHPDLLLPTYEELFGDEWDRFAPTFADLGLSEYVDGPPKSFEITQGGPQDAMPERGNPAVTRDDIVSPAIWFYNKRSKDEIKKMAKASVEAVNQTGPSLSLSVPFNTSDIKELKEAIDIKNSSKVDSPEYNKSNKTIEKVIKEAFIKHRSSGVSYREDIATILTYGQKFESFYLSGNNPIKLYIHHNGNSVLPRDVNIPSLGAEIYSVVSRRKELLDDGIGKIDADSNYTTVLDKDIKFRRNLDSNNLACVNSSIDQIPDDHLSAERMFPAIKVYLLDRRGTDLISDDTLFSLNAIISVDITMDKEDAPLAVIKIADPFYTLQNDYFEKSNKVYSDTDNKPKKILSSLKEADKDSVLKRYKLIQGRAIQIKMGYGSVPYNLPIVFTGRISEIVPGDQLTIVAQGWKAELINRSVNFYNDDPRNYGARDLAIQAMTYASPEGFGDFYPEFDAQYILRNMNPEDISEVIKQSTSVSEGVILDTVGTRTIAKDLANSFIRFINLPSLDKDDKGFDTRLKNIWYPDTSLYNNVLGWRNWFKVMPAWMNTSWVVPLQPAWDVLQEAARHAWNCIVDVVPYDGEATLFMGHPDQPYIYTRGVATSRKGYKKYVNTTTKSISKNLDILIEGFLKSELYSKRSEELRKFANSRGIERFPYVNSNLTDLTSIVSLKDAIFVVSSAGKEFSANDVNIKKSSLPGSKISELSSNGFYDRPATILFGKFFNIPLSDLNYKWTDSENVLMSILSTDYGDFNTSDIPDLINSFQNNNYLNKVSLERASIFFDYERRLKDAEGTTFRNPNTVEGLPTFKRPTNYTEIETITRTGRTDVISLKQYIRKNVLNNNKYKELLAILDQLEAAYINKNLEDIYTATGLLKIYTDARSIQSDSYSLFNGLGLSGSIWDNIVVYKAFCYFFALHCLQNDDAKRISNKIQQEGKADTGRLPPNMRVFRVHHFVDDVHNIIQNNIVASTSEMWNSVVIEHPATEVKDTLLEEEGELYGKNRINSGANWIYYPKQEVTGVIGLQFHPGLTLANKKVKVFTELNCQAEDLSMKLAHGHLAEGIRKMYRGNLLITGKHMKPHDRIVLADNYTKMSGPVEVESVIHHWNTSQGWVTNITPNAVCDANPGSAALQTAALEATFTSVFNGIELVSDALTYAIIISTLGAGTPLAIGKFGARKGLTNIAKRFLTKTPIRSFVGGTATAYKRFGRERWKDIKEFAVGGSAFTALKKLIVSVGGPGISMLKQESAAAILEWGTHALFKHNAISAFIEAGDKVEQLPVILSPLVFNGNPFTAGLETEDSIWAVSAFGVYYSARALQDGASRFLRDFFGKDE